MTQQRFTSSIFNEIGREFTVHDAAYGQYKRGAKMGSAVAAGSKIPGGLWVAATMEYLTATTQAWATAMLPDGDPDTQYLRHRDGTPFDAAEIAAAQNPTGEFVFLGVSTMGGCIERCYYPHDDCYPFPAGPSAWPLHYARDEVSEWNVNEIYSQFDYVTQGFVVVYAAEDMRPGDPVRVLTEITDTDPATSLQVLGATVTSTGGGAPASQAIPHAHVFRGGPAGSAVILELGV